MLSRGVSLGLDCSGGASEKKEGLCGGITGRVTAAQIPKRGVSEAGVGKPSHAEGRITLSDPIASLDVHVNLGVSQQRCGKEIVWLHTEGNEPG